MDVVDRMLARRWSSADLLKRRTELARLATGLQKQGDTFATCLSERERKALAEAVRTLARLQRGLADAARKKRRHEEEQRAEWERKDRDEANAAAAALFARMSPEEVVSTCEYLKAYLAEAGREHWGLNAALRKCAVAPTPEHLHNLQHCAGRAVLEELQHSWSRRVSLEGFHLFRAERRQLMQHNSAGSMPQGTAGAPSCQK